ncbi:MAG: ribosomal subunit protein large subunit ribosomal protein [Candidatus Parcubacteria bacterium]|jgi:large subunit ribosomal protein L23
MALFSRKKTEETNVAAVQSSTSPALRSLGAGWAHVLRRPRITEKATMHSNESVYTFDIDGGATKRDVIQAVRAMYNVTPRMVRITRIPSKIRRSMRTGKRGIKHGGKKAYVYLKKGETITIA